MPSRQSNLTVSQKLAITLLIWESWFLMYQAFIFLSVPKDAFLNAISFDALRPFWSWSVLFYVSLYLWAMLLPFLFTTQQQGRYFMVEGMLGMALIFYCYVTIPSVLDYQAVTSNDFFAKWIELGRKADGESAAFPSFHVFWALICYCHTVLQFSRLKRPLAVLAWAIVVSCLTTHNHTLLEWSDLFCDHTFLWY